MIKKEKGVAKRSHMKKGLIALLCIICGMTGVALSAENISVDVELENGVHVTVPDHILRKSKTLKNLLNDASGSINLSAISAPTFKSLVRYLTFISQQTSADARAFIAQSLAKKKDLQKIVRLLKAADYLDIQQVQKIAQTEIIKRLRQEGAVNSYLADESFIDKLAFTSYLKQDIADILMRDYLATALLKATGIAEKRIIPKREKPKFWENKEIEINQVAGLAISQDGKKFAIVDDKKIYVCNSKTQLIESIINAPFVPSRLALNADGSLLAVSIVGGGFDRLYVYDIRTQKCIYEKVFGRGLRSLCISGDNKFLLVVTEDDQVELCDLSDQEIASTIIHRDTKWIYQASFNSDDSLIAVCADSGTFIYARNGIDEGKDIDEPKGNVLLKQFPSCLYAAFSSSGTWLACGNGKGNVVLYDIETEIPLKKIDVYKRVNGLYFMQNDTRLLVSTYDGPASIWDIPIGAKLHEFEPTIRSMAGSRGHYMLTVKMVKSRLTGFYLPSVAVYIDLKPFFALERKLLSKQLSLEQVLLINVVFTYHDWNEKLILPPHLQAVMATLDPEIQKVLNGLGTIKKDNPK